MAVSMSVAQADYALKLLKESAAADSATIISPFSVAAALAIAYLGSDGKTREQMNALLAEGNSDEVFHHYLTEQMEGILKGSDGYKLDTANRLYVHSGFQLKDSFVNAVKTKYSGQLKSADFKNPEAVAKEINTFVEDTTNQKIRNLISSDNIKEDSRLIIVNAIYFKGDWAAKFQKSFTKELPFYYAENKERQVEMMFRGDKYNYYEDDSVQVLGMPYKGEEVEMFIFLPKQKYGLADYLEALTGQKLMYCINGTRLKSVEVFLPKFKLEKKFELTKALAKLGMPNAFTTVADFSGISESPLYISDVIHKAYVEINEEGTEAAAATGIGMRLRSAPMQHISPVQFKADHPFMFAIVKGYSLLFVGRYA